MQPNIQIKTLNVWLIIFWYNTANVLYRMYIKVSHEVHSPKTVYNIFTIIVLHMKLSWYNSLRELHWWACFECYRKCVILLFPPRGIKQTYLKGVAWYLSILNTITFDLLRELLLSADSRFCCLLYSSCCEVYCCLMKLI